MHELHLIESIYILRITFHVPFGFMPCQAAVKIAFTGELRLRFRYFPGGYAIEVRFRVIFLIEIDVHSFFAPSRNPDRQ